MSTVKHDDGKVRGKPFNPWYLLLIVPLLVLVTPLFNMDGPRLFGMPFFYWFQFLFVAVGVLSTWIVYLMTREKPAGDAPDKLSVDDLDEGDAR
ncbi:DUF3311 domain-containing protein [Amycolatopsis sp. WQ 127309]|uniref:DUF3311 domain-containing protein n=1 Tax=Amycolatopsis sp. WQ 127309 TaxID=2932773 RepID=UPI001FF63B6F|nr:DUF3311 domain-containing protein [Amycolatopsis sp. WQ 127309]UOZ08893.1 DUF3311 domain-containing protein [Amycolatopsis sp. WQ 127309]